MTGLAALAQFRTLVVEDHKPFLDYICSALRERSDVEIVGQVQNGLEAVEFAAAVQPDLIFLDIGLPGINGIEAACRILKLAPSAKIIFLTQKNTPDILHEALKSGALGYVLKPRCNNDLQAAIEAALLGKRFVSAGLDGLGNLSSDSKFHSPIVFGACYALNRPNCAF